MGLLDRLFGRRSDDGSDELLTRALDRTVEVVEPRLALASDWRARLTPGVEAAVDFARSTASELQDFHEAAPAAWNADPLVRAMFATADDVRTSLGRSDELRGFLGQTDAGSDCYAVLGADFATRRVLGAALEGDQVRHDAALTQAHFGAHRIRIVADSPEPLRRAVGVRVFNELLLAATRRLAEADQQRKDLDVTRALLQARLRMLERGESALEPSGATGESGDVALERADVERQLAAMTGAMENLGAGVQGIDRKLDIVRDTLLVATQSVRVERRTLRLDAMNNVIDEAQGGAPIEFLLITTREFTRAYVPIHIRKSDVPQGGLRFADAERVL